MKCICTRVIRALEKLTCVRLTESFRFFSSRYSFLSFAVGNIYFTIVPSYQFDSISITILHIIVNLQYRFTQFTPIRANSVLPRSIYTKSFIQITINEEI